jgi:hypothetical protein
VFALIRKLKPGDMQLKGCLRVTEPVLIENVGMSLTAFVCRRRTSNPKLKIRKFKAVCGSYMTFYHDGAGHIERVEEEHNNCESDCIICKAQNEKATFLIENNK